jgi:hypothetical protein
MAAFLGQTQAVPLLEQAGSAIDHWTLDQLNSKQLCGAVQVLQAGPEGARQNNSKPDHGKFSHVQDQSENTLVSITYPPANQSGCVKDPERRPAFVR